MRIAKRLQIKLEFRAITNSHRKSDNAIVMSSTMPSVNQDSQMFLRSDVRAFLVHACFVKRNATCHCRKLNPASK